MFKYSDLNETVLKLDDPWIRHVLIVTAVYYDTNASIQGINDFNWYFTVYDNTDVSL